MFKRIFTFTRVLWLLIAGIFLNLAYILYLALYPFPTFVFNNNPFPIANQQPIKAGDVLTYVIDYCRYTDAPAQLTRTLIGPTIITIAQDTSITSEGCKKVTVTNTVIPSYAPSGTYYLKLNICVQSNPIRTTCQQVRTQDFQIKKTDQ